VYFPQEWPPYIEGAISLMSVDLIYYVYTNKQWLQPMSHLEDVTMAIWMLALQVCVSPPRLPLLPAPTPGVI
jgi:hypothetical protein